MAAPKLALAKTALIFVSLCFFLLLAVWIGITFGTARLSLLEVWRIILFKLHISSYLSIEPIHQAIVWDIRLPRVLIALFVGAMLSVVGAALQGLLRNALADPYIIGTSSGAAFGAVVAFALGWGKAAGFGWQGMFLLPASAFCGAVITMALVFFIARRAGGLSLEVFLLAGVVVGSFLWALITFFLTLLGENTSKVLFWLMGSFADKGWGHAAIVVFYAFIGIPFLLSFSYQLNLLSLGEEKASRLGVNVEKTKRLILFLSVFLTAISVAVGGIIGFVGLLVPHMVRLIVGPDYRILLPAALFCGAILLVLSDTLARIIVAPDRKSVV